MSDCNYVVVFDPLDDRFDPLAVRQAMQTEERVTHWWNHILNSFLVTFDGGSDDLSSALRRHSNGVRFFVMQVDPRNSEGFLPERSWSWIRKRERELAGKTTEPTT